MPDIHIRPMKPTDEHAIDSVIKSVWPSEGLQPDYAQIVVVAELNSEVIGFCAGFATPEWDGKTRWNVDLLAVRPEAQGNGVGRRLIAANLEAACSYDYAHTVIAVDNMASASAFRACGFTTDHITRTLTITTPVDIYTSEPEGVTILPVDTLTYRGVWVEPHPGKDYDARLIAGVAYGRYVACQQKRTVVGAFASPAQAEHLVNQFDAHAVGDYYWFIKGGED